MDIECLHELEQEITDLGVLSFNSPSDKDRLSFGFSSDRFSMLISSTSILLPTTTDDDYDIGEQQGQTEELTQQQAFQDQDLVPQSEEEEKQGAEGETKHQYCQGGMDNDRMELVTGIVAEDVEPEERGRSEEKNKKTNDELLFKLVQAPPIAEEKDSSEKHGSGPITESTCTTPNHKKNSNWTNGDTDNFLDNFQEELVSDDNDDEGKEQTQDDLQKCHRMSENLGMVMTVDLDPKNDGSDTSACHDQSRNCVSKITSIESETKFGLFFSSSSSSLKMLKTASKVMEKKSCDCCSKQLNELSYDNRSLCFENHRLQEVIDELQKTHQQKNKDYSSKISALESDNTNLERACAELEKELKETQIRLTRKIRELEEKLQAATATVLNLDQAEHAGILNEKKDDFETEANDKEDRNNHLCNENKNSNLASPGAGKLEKRPQTMSEQIKLLRSCLYKELHGPRYKTMRSAWQGFFKPIDSKVSFESFSSTLEQFDNGNKHSRDDLRALLQSMKQEQDSEGLSISVSPDSELLWKDFHKFYHMSID